MTRSPSNSRIYQFVFEAGEKIESDPFDYSLKMMRTIGAARIDSPQGENREILYRGPFIPSQEQVIDKPEPAREK